MKVVWSRRALDAVDQYAALIARDNVDAAHRWTEGILGSVDHLGDFPESGRVVPEVGLRSCREVL